MYSPKEYESSEPKAFAEIILDGTSANKKGIRNIIMLNYPNGIYSRNPEESEESYDATLKRFNVDSNSCRLIPGYRKNLEYYGYQRDV